MLRLLASSALAAGLLALAPVAQASRTATLSLQVVFLSDGTIDVTLPDGTPVGTTSGPPTVIPAGAYTVVMSGPGGCIQLPLFSLRGPGMNIVSDMNGGEVDAATYNAFFPTGSTFTWRTDRGVAAVTHTFVTSGTVAGAAGSAAGAGSASTASKPTSEDIVGSAIVPLRGTLSGEVGADGSLTVSFNGKRVGSLLAGRYRIAVTDRSIRGGLMLVRGKKTVRVTGAAFVGRHAVTVQLTEGRWQLSTGLPGRTTAVVVR